MKTSAQSVWPIAITSFMVALGASAQQPVNKADPAIYPKMRSLALRTPRAGLALPKQKSPVEPWAAIVDTTFPEGGSYTIVAMVDGNASIYLSSGGGFIGGFAHETVKTAAKHMVRAAVPLQANMTKVEAFPLPKPGYTTFYLRTDTGVYEATARTDELGEKRSSLWPLFYATQEVVTQYRLVEQN